MNADQIKSGMIADLMDSIRTLEYDLQHWSKFLTEKQIAAIKKLIAVQTDAAMALNVKIS